MNYCTSRPPAEGRNRNWGCRFPKGDSGIQNAECACRRTVVRTAVGLSLDGCRTAVGRPSDGRWTIVGRPSDARMTVVGRFTVLSRNPIFDARAHSSRAALISPYRREVSFSIRFFLELPKVYAIQHLSMYFLGPFLVTILMFLQPSKKRPYRRGRVNIDDILRSKEPLFFFHF